MWHDQVGIPLILPPILHLDNIRMRIQLEMLQEDAFPQHSIHTVFRCKCPFVNLLDHNGGAIWSKCTRVYLGYPTTPDASSQSILTHKMFLNYCPFQEGVMFQFD